MRSHEPRATVASNPQPDPVLSALYISTQQFSHSIVRMGKQLAQGHTAREWCSCFITQASWFLSELPQFYTTLQFKRTTLHSEKL